MKAKLRVAILYGGRSAEHEISLQSARNIVEAMDKKKYDPVLIGIDKDGRWFLDEDARLLHDKAMTRVQPRRESNALALIPGEPDELITATGRRRVGRLDVVFPVLHGPFGEDGTVQGLLKLANVPFVGAGVLGSAVGMDKDVMKRLLRDARVPIAKFAAFERGSKSRLDFAKTRRNLGSPLFIKPANLGSSVGISKARNKREFDRAVAEAFRYDNKILVEEYIQGREIECSVLGNEDPIASLPGEIVTPHEFYSYEAKYIDEKGAMLKIPASLPGRVAKKIQELSVKAFKALCCEGMARVDFFLRGNREVFVNEINTIPGFTRISMYPKLWAASGISPTELIDRLIRLGMERFKKERDLKTSFAGQ